MISSRKIFALIFAASMVAGAAQGQENRSLHISDGKVFVDGNQVPASRLPASLDVENLNVHYSFTGDVRPVVDINGRFFVIEGDGLREAERGEHDDVSVYLRGNVPGVPSMHRFNFQGDAAGMRYRAAPADGVVGFTLESGEPGDISDFVPHGDALDRKVKELQAQAVKLEELQGQLQGRFDFQHVKELEQAARQLTLHAEEAARVAGAMPQIEMQQYLAGIQRKDKGLFDRLMNERERERETIQLARELRSMSESAARQERQAELRQKLAEIFDLKQANRQEEIGRLEDRLEDLQSKLQERERMREEIIDRRLRQLLNLEDELNW